MSKCFLTGIEVPLESAFVLDRGATKRALRNLRERLAALERLLSQLGQKDSVERFDPRSKTMKARVENRLVCPSVAAALATSYPESPLFITWKEFMKRRSQVFPDSPKQKGKAQAGKQDTRNEIRPKPNDEKQREDSHGGAE
ncbi:MAG: hypothetical protein ACLQVM_20785 [Terriglobia bacterium]